ncbi:MAG: flagellar protein FliT [Pseudomonadota bacterium]
MFNSTDSVGSEALDVLDAIDALEKGIEGQAREVITTCQEMLTLASSGEWIRVLELDARRSRELATYLGTPDLTPSDISVRRDTLETIIELNAALVEEAQGAHLEVGRELQRLKTNSQAVRAYGREVRLSTMFKRSSSG